MAEAQLPEELQEQIHTAYELKNKIEKEAEKQKVYQVSLSEPYPWHKVGEIVLKVLAIIMLLIALIMVCTK